VELNLRQVQDTKDGTPILATPLTIGVLSDEGDLKQTRVDVSKSSEDIAIPSEFEPKVILIDPDHEILWQAAGAQRSTAELLLIFKHARDASDREKALVDLLNDNPSESTLAEVVDQLRSDDGRFPVFRSLSAIANLMNPNLRQFLRDQVHRVNARRSAGGAGHRAFAP
jgi:hypothetical protein